MPKKPQYFWLTALVTAWAVDFLFFSQRPGISLFIWAFVLLAGGVWLARKEDVKPAPLTWVLMGLILISSAIAFIRVEPVTTVVSVFLTIAGLILLAATFRNGNWPFFRTWDTIGEMLSVLVAGITRPFGLFKAEPVDDPSQQLSARRRFWKQTAPVLRGLLLAVPVLAVLSLLLSSADMVFADRLKAFFSFFDIERLPEYIFRVIYILILTFVFTGVFLHAVLPLKKAIRPDASQPVIKPFLGWTEAVIVLGAVVLLFAFFVVLQFQYLFGGQANITAAGYTYSEYARRGFGELVAVAVISLVLTLTLGSIARREEGGRRTAFTVLSALLLALVLVILGSALQRLLLYEGAYGFTRLRTYTLMFIPWLGLLLLAAIVLEISRRGGRFGFALLVAVVGFGLTLGAVNVDGFIARQNIERGLRGEEFDHQYLGELSTDAVPVMLRYYHQPGLDDQIKQGIGAELACQAFSLNDGEQPSWKSFTISRSTALGSLAGENFSSYAVEKTDGVEFVTIDGKQETCQPEYGMD